MTGRPHPFVSPQRERLAEAVAPPHRRGPDRRGRDRGAARHRGRHGRGRGAPPRPRAATRRRPDRAASAAAPSATTTTTSRAPRSSARCRRSRRRIEWEFVDGRIVGARHRTTPRTRARPATCTAAGSRSTFDEILGMANIASGHPGMTGTLKVRYLRPTPLHRRSTSRAGPSGSRAAASSPRAR